MEYRIFDTADYAQPAPGEPIRSVVRETADAVVVMWHVLPGQVLRPHVHPAGQDTWIVLAGEADYIASPDGATRPLAAGQIAMAGPGQVHGAINRGHLPFQFVSVVAPAQAGFELVED